MTCLLGYHWPKQVMFQSGLTGQEGLLLSHGITAFHMTLWLSVAVSANHSKHSSLKQPPFYQNQGLCGPREQGRVQLGNSAAACGVDWGCPAVYSWQTVCRVWFDVRQRSGTFTGIPGRLGSPAGNVKTSPPDSSGLPQRMSQETRCGKAQARHRHITSAEMCQDKTIIEPTNGGNTQSLSGAEKY